MAPHASTEHLSFSEVLKSWRENSQLDHQGPEKALEDRKLQSNWKWVTNPLKDVDYSRVIWKNVAAFTLLHIVSIYGLFLVVTSCAWKTLIFSYFLYLFGSIGVTMGAHRLWSHRSMKANLPIRVILAICQTLAFQNDIYVWARDHRAHHKFSETDADPHNASRGFFFAHMGWLLYRKHPAVLAKGKTLDVSDVLQDPVVRFQRKFYVPLVVLITFVLPAIIPWYFWQEDLVTAAVVSGFLRYCLNLHVTWSVNSVAHWVGSKPYDKSISPSQNTLVSLITVGEGWHNFHHVFPQDYRSAELGGFHFNLTTSIIDSFASFGWIWDRKTVSPSVIKRRASRTGES